MRPAIFLDRDGTIIVERHYLGDRVAWARDRVYTVCADLAAASEAVRALLPGRPAGCPTDGRTRCDEARSVGHDGIARL